MKQIIEVKNKSIGELIDEDGIINAIKKIKCNERFSFISPDFIIGEGTVIYYFCNLFGKSKIGKNCIISSYTEIQGGVKLGDGSRVGSHSFLCSGLEIGNNVFLGSYFCSINDRHPKSHNANYLQEKTIIKNNVSIGSSVTVMCGVTIGESSIVGAGSLVLKDVPDGEIWLGQPARFIKKI